MYCNRCGTELGESVKFCGHCGVSVQATKVDSASELSDDPEDEEESWAWLSVKALGGIAVVFFGYILWSSPNSDVYSCAIPPYEQYSIQECSKKGFVVDCLFTNTANLPVTLGSVSVWQYDKRGYVVDKQNLTGALLTAVKPGETVHAKFFDVSGANDSVICSVDPKSSVIGGKSKWLAAN